jgi:uncharacterized small protein (DUF1192 family)
MDGQWLTYGEAAVRLGVSIDAIRRRAARGHWARMPGNDGKARVQVPDDLPIQRLGAAQDDAPTLVRALEAHIATLKADIERLTAELAGEKERAATDLAGERAARQADQAHAGKLVAELAAERERAGAVLAAAEARIDKAVTELAAEKARADQAAVDLAGERTARKTDQRLASKSYVDQVSQIADRDEQLAAARVAADKATAELVALAQRLAAIAEDRSQRRADIPAPEPEPPRRSRLGRAWGWLLRN